MSQPAPADAQPADCPAWCEYSGHHLDEWETVIDTGLPIRYHEATVAPAPDAPVWAYLLAEEELHADGRVLGQLFIDAGVNEFQDGKRLHGLTAEQARAFAALLTRAADRADEITGGGAPCR